VAGVFLELLLEGSASWIGATYVDDPPFRKYYDAIAVGCAEFLRDAIKIYCE